MTRYQWPITDEGMDMTLDELKAEALEPGGALDAALFEHHVVTTGEPLWHIDSSRPESRLVCDVPVALWDTKRDPAPADHSMRQAVA